MTVGEFQDLIRRLYGDRDAERGLPRTFMWLVEEVGELARALQDEDPQRIREEFADVLAWLTTLATLADIDLQAAAAERYGAGCPKCEQLPCRCPRDAL